MASSFDHDKHRKMMDAITGRNSIARMMEDQRKMLDLMSGRAMRKQMDLISGRAMREQMGLVSGRVAREQMDLISGRAARGHLRFVSGPVGKDQLRTVTGQWEASRRLWSTIAARPFASVIGAQDSIAKIVSQPSFASMVGTATLPLADWSRTLEGLRGIIPDDLYEDTAAGFEAVAEATGEGETETWWIARLPLVMQVGLLLFVLQTIEAATAFVGDVTGVDVPPAVRSGTQALFVLAATIVAFVEASARVNRGEDRE